MVLISSLLVGGLGYIWYSQMRETSKSIEVKALVNMHLMSHLIEESRLGKVHMPYYIDEAASIDWRNQQILIEQIEDDEDVDTVYHNAN